MSVFWYGLIAGFVGAFFLLAGLFTPGLVLVCGAAVVMAHELEAK